MWQSPDSILNEYMNGQTNGGVFNPKNLNMFGYTYNNPVNLSDPDGNAVKAVKSIYNILKKTYNNGGDFKKASTDELLDVMDNVSELMDGDLTADDFFAAVDLLTGFGKEAKQATKALKRSHGNKLDDKPAEGYTLRDRKTGEIKKYGETTRGEDTFGSGKQKRYSKKYLKENNVRYIKEVSGTKKDMHKWQHEKILDHKAQNGGQRPKMNKSDY